MAETTYKRKSKAMSKVVNIVLPPVTVGSLIFLVVGTFYSLGVRATCPKSVQLEGEVKGENYHNVSRLLHAYKPEYKFSIKSREGVKIFEAGSSLARDLDALVSEGTTVKLGFCEGFKPNDLNHIYNYNVLEIYGKEVNL